MNQLAEQFWIGGDRARAAADKDAAIDDIGHVAALGRLDRDDRLILIGIDAEREQRLGRDIVLQLRLELTAHGFGVGSDADHAAL